MHIETVTLRAADLGALHTFYADRLGLPAALDDWGECLTVTVNSSQLVFQHEAGFAGVYHFAFNVPENRLATAQAFLEERGIALLADGDGETVFDFDFWNAHALYFHDAAGNIAEFIARHELASTSSGVHARPFSPSEIQSISEIGLPSLNVPALATLLSASGVAPYRETSPTFMPLGDAHGLFILVPAGRVWFPDTGIAAEAYPVQAVVRNDAGARFDVQGVPYQITTL